MKPRRPALIGQFMIGLLGGLLMLAATHALAAKPLPEGESVAPAMAALIEREWIEQDAAWQADRSLKAVPPPLSGKGPGVFLPPETTDAPKHCKETPFALLHTRQVLDRAERLAGRLGAAVPKELLGQLAAVDKRLAALEEQRGGAKPDQRKAVYLDARHALRAIALNNPLLSKIDRLLLIKRHDPGGPFHMCDQYYGCNQKRGGGVFVLVDPFGEDPRLVNLLEGQKVQQGRLKGQELRGSFVSPEVTYDGRTIYFAHTECGAKRTYQWFPEASYHIFKCAADGSDLVQLTDGEHDDFDPCELPGGRIAFVSTRRGGYLRCGRHCPNYAICSMEPDGSDIINLSYHETHEWHPSVDNHGMLVYSRWDYVDRDTNVAHHIWLSYPDGRDPRSYHGNYPANGNRKGRPWMEQSIRAIPGSHQYVAVTGAHHGHAFGSLVLIDQRREDDGACSQLTRLTPEIGFAEAEVSPTAPGMCYGTPWPLSEKDYLCVFDRKAKNRGIYWIDSDGNRELIYRDPKIHCLSPMPLRPRPKPPVIPDKTVQTARAIEAHNGKIPPSTVAVMNVYDSDFTWPEGSEIKALRVIQVLPKTTAPPNNPRIGVANQTNARAVLGTAPVEADGSAFFEVPAGKEIYFQALDAEGMAVQSMRSGTYLHPGESLTCQGCHEPKRRQTPPMRKTPLALQRAPSKLAPGPEGSNPFNYVQLVQPVLDKHCVACHEEKKAVSLVGKPHGSFSVSYNALAAKHGFYFNVRNGSIGQPIHGGARTVPGKFGAQAASLMKYIETSHYGVKLSPEERERIITWLDCNSEFLGAYYDVGRQQRGQPVEPRLD